MFKTLFSLSPTLCLIGLISFVNNAVSEMLVLLMPFYLAAVLMARLKALGLSQAPMFYWPFLVFRNQSEYQVNI
jgi:hypothetical protein